MEAVVNGTEMQPTFRDGLYVQKVLGASRPRTTPDSGRRSSRSRGRKPMASATAGLSPPPVPTR